MVQHSLQRVKLGSHLLREALDIRLVDDLQALLQLVLGAGLGRELQIALYLLANLLEAVEYGHAGYRVNTRQRLQTDVCQTVLPGNFTEIYDRLCRRMNAKQCVVCMTRIPQVLIMVHNELVMMLPPGEYVVPMGQIV